MGNGRKIVGIRPHEGDRADTPVDALVDAAVGQAAEPLPPQDAAVPPAPDPELHIDAAETGGFWLPDDVSEADDARFPWVGSLFVIVALAWGGFLAWSQSGAFTRLPSIDQWPILAMAFSAPLALLALCLLLFDRGSDRSHRRHLRTLAALRREQSLLGDRLALIDGLWRDAQSQLVARSEALQQESTRAAASVTEAVSILDDRMHKTVIQSATINQQAEKAQRAMDALLVALPKIEEVGVRATEAIRESGQLAYQYGGQLEAQIAAVNHESGEAQRALSAAQQQIGDEITAFQRMVDAAEANAARLASGVAATIAEQQQSALGSVASLRSELDAARQTSIDIQAAISAAGEAGSAASASLAQAAAAIDRQVRDIESRFDEGARAMSARLTELDGDIAKLDLSGEAATSSAEQFAARADAVVLTLHEIRQEIDVSLPQAVDRLQAMLAASQSRIDALPAAINLSSDAAKAVLRESQGVELSLASQTSVATELDARIRQALAEQEALIATMQESADRLAERLRQIAEADAARAADAVAAIDASAKQVVEQSVEQLQHSIKAAIETSTGDAVRQRLMEVVAASDQAVAAASAASDRLMRELITIADSSAAIEARAQQAAASLETSDRNSLARQLASLTEALQSTAVDLTRLLDSDVADQAWESYLRGDRSIFARRSLRLLTGAEAKTIRSRYEADDELRLMINRYIQEFETMLRLTMDTRDGSAVAVTLLSSDIGKVYVALAQAIERLRG